MLKKGWGAESNGKLPHLFIPSQTAILVAEFAVEELPLGRTAALVPALVVKDLPLGRSLWWLYMLFKLPLYCLNVIIYYLLLLLLLLILLLLLLLLYYYYYQYYYKVHSENKFQWPIEKTKAAISKDLLHYSQRLTGDFSAKLASLLHGRLARWRKWRSCNVEKRKKGWRMSCDVGEATEWSENELWRK